MHEPTRIGDRAAAATATEEPSLAATGEAPELVVAPQSQSDITHEDQRMQEVLPAIVELAHRVGGLPQLAEIIDTLRHARG
jgi:hypothetical protein